MEVDIVCPNGDRPQDRAEKPKEWVGQLVLSKWDGRYRSAATFMTMRNYSLNADVMCGLVPYSDGVV